MRIAIVCLNLGWQTGGPRLIFSFAQGLVRGGHKVVLYAPDFDPTTYPELSAGLDIRVVKPDTPVAWVYAHRGLIGRIGEKIRQQTALNAVARKIADVMDADFDIVNPHDFAYRILPRYTPRNLRAKVVWTMNDVPYAYLPKRNHFYDLASRVYNWFTDHLASWRYFPLIRHAVVFIERNAQWLNERGIPTTIIWPGVEYDAFYAPVKKFSIPKKSFTLLGVGAFNRFRRYDDIIAAGALLRSEGYDARVLLICKDIWDAKQDKKDILQRTLELGMKPYVTFRFEGASEEGLKRAYRESDIFVAATHIPPPRNGFSWGLALFEAVASGIPVVLSNRNDATDALVDGKGALLFEPENPKDIAAKVKRLMDDPQLYYDIGTAAQKLVKEKMNWDYYARKFAELCEEKK